ncbi:hypothetical protein HN51_044850, partial [Arachis hypogaea]
MPPPPQARRATALFRHPRFHRPPFLAQGCVVVLWSSVDDDFSEVEGYLEG